MTKLQSLSVFVDELLTVAAVEILGAVEKVIAEYQEEISRSKEENDQLRRLLRITPDIKISSIDNPKCSLAISEEEATSVQHTFEQEWSSDHGAEDTKPIRIKEEVGTTHEVVLPQRLEADIIEFTFTPWLKSDSDQEDPLPSSTVSQTKPVENREPDSKPLVFNTLTHLDTPCHFSLDNALSHSSATSSSPVESDINPLLDPNPSVKKITTMNKKTKILSTSRVKVRDPDRGLFHPQTFERAAHDVLVGGQSIRSAAKAHGLCHVTLFRYCRRKKDSCNAGVPAYRAHNRVFSDEQEKTLMQYLLRASDIFYGLSPKEVRRLAYQLAQHYSCKFPDTWDTKEMAGKDWFNSFLKRHPDFSIRPQATSLQRARSFNVTNVSQFFDNLSAIQGRHNFEAKDMWNMDETSTTAVQVMEKSSAYQGRELVEAMTSAERGTLVTMALAVNAQGDSIPPHFILPGEKVLDHFLSDRPAGCVVTSSASGWMQENDFLTFLQHFVKYTQASTQCPRLLLLDNHASHLCLRGIDYCQANGVVLLSFPPHCSHKLQPLERSVYGPLRRCTNRAIDCWMNTHLGETLSIHLIPGLMANALASSATPANIMDGFRCTGIWPLNPAIFVTDRPDSVVEEPAAGAEAQPRVEVYTSPAGHFVSSRQAKV
ncbi:uncharacterized protein LOC105018472 isoform X1 [Esox lucius]|uniref:HTH CENPB-type domain-containing protein n=1 Tax=Esox lucius TaxID=8010 RepID=A0A3P8XDA2_ESOLU|nr:uncharacterized protein LOC105018472 isoform X1 [Esox lucius]